MSSASVMFHDADYTASDAELFLKFRIYNGLGGATLLLNVIIIFVIVTDTFLKRKMVLYIFLAAADAINGIAYVVSGIGRNYVVTHDEHLLQVSVWDCMTKKPWPVLLFIGADLPVFTNVLLALELAIAAFQPALYRRYWRLNKKIAFGIVGWLVCGVWVAMAFVSARYSKSRTSLLCSVINSAGVEFGSVNFFAMAVFNTLSILVVCRVYLITRNLNALNKNELLRQKVLLAIEFISLFQIGIPSILLVIDMWGVIRLSFFATECLYIIYGSSGIWKILVYLLFRHDFRSHFFRLLRIKRFMPEGGAWKSEISRSKVSAWATVRQANARSDEHGGFLRRICIFKKKGRTLRNTAPLSSEQE
uniref:G_PROTEIN_RECEP_F1_2 domain-containing protein n=1 Tax=Syphacia muris TaxID=451379 RepID=A0A0N5AM86_9BILA